jgi:flagellar biosynthesis protein
MTSDKPTIPFIPSVPLPEALDGQTAPNTDNMAWQQAVALAYKSGHAAPTVVAKGRGFVAEEIIKRAKEAGLYVHESKELVGLLMQVELDRHIPPQLYVAIAELLTWIYRLENRAVNPDGSPTSRRTDKDAT